MDLVDLDEVIWTEPPEREEAGSPNVVGAVAFGAAMDELERIGWDTIEAHERALSRQLHDGLRAIDGVTVLGPPPGTDTLAVASFVVAGMHHALGRRPAERRVRHRRPPRLLLRAPVPHPPARRRWRRHRRGPRGRAPGRPQRHSRCGPGQLRARHVGRRHHRALLDALGALAAGQPAPVAYEQDSVTGDFWPAGEASGWSAADRPAGAACARG